MTRSKQKNTTAPKGTATPEWSTTAIHLPKSTLQLLKLAAFHRAQKHGGRISVSKLLTDIVESHRKELERDISN